jgi:hypothetical protein
MLRPQSYLKLSYSLIALSGLALLVYVILKAQQASFTHDESFTYLDYVHQSFMDIISYKTPYTNNHILNTVLMKYAEELWGSSELVLRLPNILACAIYLVYGFRLLKRMPLVMVFPAFLCLICHMQLCDFFSLARGYGLSFAFMLMSLYHLIRYFDKPESKQLIFFQAGSLLAIFGNFSLINVYLSALVTYNMICWYRTTLHSSAPRYRFFRENRIHLWALLIFVAVLYEPIRRISKQGMLHFGGKEGFLENTFGSLIGGAFYETPLGMPLYTTIKICMFLLVLITGLLIGWQMFRKNRRFFEQHIALCTMWLILMGIVVLSYLQHYLIRNDFYGGRFALFIYPLVMLNLLFLLDYLYRIRVRVFSTSLVYGLGALLALNFSLNTNLSFYKDWKYDAGTKTVMTILAEDHAKQPATGKKVSLGINWIFEPSTNFYRYTRDLSWLKKTHRKGAKAGDDYYYLFRSDTNAYLANGKPLLFSLGGVNTFLVKNTTE